MGITEAVAALETAALMSRSKAVQDLVGLVLSKLEGLGDRDTNPDNGGPLTNAEKCRRYRDNRKRDTVSTPSDTGESVAATPVSLALSSLSSSPGLTLSLSDSRSLEDTGSGESTGARAGETTPSLPESRTQRVAPNGDHAQVVAAFAEEFERIRGVKPDIGAKGGAGAKALLRGRTVEEAIAIVRRAFEDPFVAEKKPDLAYIAGNANAYMGRAPNKPARPGAPAMQPVPATGRLWKVGQ